MPLSPTPEHTTLSHLRPSLRTTRIIAIITGLFGALLFLIAPFLPVNHTTSTVQWPQQQSVRSIQAPLIAHSPAHVEVRIPFSAVRAMEGQENGIIMGTLPSQSTQATQRGLFVRVSRTTVDILSRDTPLLTLNRQEVVEASPRGSITLTIDANGAVATVRGLPDKDGSTAPSVTRTENFHLRPITMGVFSDLPLTVSPSVVKGLSVTLDLDTRFTTSPTLLKILVMLMGLILMVTSWMATARIDRLVSPTTHIALAGESDYNPTARSPWRTLRPVDVVVTVLLGVWHIIGANTSDDGYILSMVRVAQQGAGYTANYYRWYGVSESPFGSPYYDLLQGFSTVSTSSMWMRLPALICALITWFLISKSLIPRLGAGLHLRKITTWTAAGVFLVFHFTFNNGARPEPFVAMMALLTWALLERAIERQHMLPATLAVLTAALALSGNPTGLMAVAALAVSLRPLLHIMAARKNSVGWAAQLAPIAASGFAVLVCVFGDQTIGSVLEATHVRGEIGPNMPWYREVIRYYWLSIRTVDGSLSRRFAVLILFLCLFVVTAILLRHRHIRGAAVGPSWRALGITYGTLALMTFSPTKWTHHFGAYAGIAPILAALAALAIGTSALSSHRNRSLVLGAVSLLTAFSLTTVNDWWFVGQYSIPWYDKPPQFHGFQFHTIFLVIALIAFVVAGYQHIAQSFHRVSPPKSSRRREQIRILAAAPITITAWLLVVFYLLTFSKAAISQYPAYSLARGNLASLTGHSCGLADDVLVEPDANRGMLKPLPHQEWERTPQNGNPRARGPLAGPGTRYFEAHGVPRILKADAINAQPGTAGSDLDPELTPTTKLEGQQAGTEGGVSENLGVNGSFAKLPYGLNPATTPILGSYQEGPQHSATLQTAWYALPSPGENDPGVIVFTAAGRIKYKDVSGIERYGQPVELEYGRQEANGSVTALGRVTPYDVGPIPAWRNMRIPRAAIPPEATAVRIVAEDTNLDPDHWVAVTPPRIPHLVSLQNYVGSTTPALVDWEMAFQFPCIRPYGHWAGVTEVPRWRISPDRHSRVNNTDTWQAARYGGSLGITEGLSSADVVPTYLKDDWGREWGSLERLTPYGTRQTQPPVMATVEHGVVKRNGWWSPGPMTIG